MGNKQTGWVPIDTESGMEPETPSFAFKYLLKSQGKKETCLFKNVAFSFAPQRRPWHTAARGGNHISLCSSKGWVLQQAGCGLITGT